jgi:hypothetical protein
VSRLSSAGIVGHVVEQLNDRVLKGVIVIASAFTFNERHDQRDISLARTLSAKGWGIIFVGWRATKEESMASIGEEVHPNIFQIPKDMLLEHPDLLAGLECPRKVFVIEFPHPDFLLCLLAMRRGGYQVVYDINKEWEELHKMGQAGWFNLKMEEALVVNANILTAVSQSLIDKFTGLRRDIHLMPDGYDPSLLGKQIF